MLLVCVAFHVCGLVGLEGLLRWFEERRKKPRSMGYFLVMMLIIANIVLLLHVLEAGAWAYLLMKLGSIDNFHMALLNSLNAITAYGHEALHLEDAWRLLGAIESMNGVMIFGLTTAFLFSALRELLPSRDAVSYHRGK